MRPLRARRPGEGRPPAGPRVLIPLLVLSAAVAQGFGRFGYALLLPAVNADLVHSYAVAGLLGTLNLTAYLAGTLVVSLTAERLAPATSVRAGLLCSTAGVAVLALAPSVPVLVAGMVLAGFGGALIWVPAPGIAGAAVPASRRGLAIGITGSGVGVGVVASSALTALVHAVAGPSEWRAVWGIEAVLAALVALAALRWLRPPPTPVAGRVRISALRAVPGWVGSMLSYGGYGLAIAVYMTFLVTAYQHDAGFAAGHASAVFALVGVCIVAGGVLVGRWSDSVGRRAAMTWTYVGMTGAVLLVPVGAEPWAVLSAVVFGLALSGAPAVLAAHLADSLDPRRFAAAFGAVTLVFGLAQLVGPQLGGWIAERTGSFTVAFLVAAGAALAAALASATLPRRGAARAVPAAPAAD
ncbi:Predicted arabinose efflux permease, MFS family [Geodermatophilus telluris]|uniref:Predicted arabinose efflux permease, MFS family n=1 Tax=Geodermatophilus telluris TaxID=1190417 RepID=A0A1G6TMU3_9ACTN|nr:Predicted arabinose efflux permease, MFS family [Geodermatophilus telluris]